MNPCLCGSVRRVGATVSSSSVVWLMSVRPPQESHLPKHGEVMSTVFLEVLRPKLSAKLRRRPSSSQLMLNLLRDRSY
eukprot:8505037-Pyramimonas_sp.AAC.1